MNWLKVFSEPPSFRRHVSSTQEMSRLFRNGVLIAGSEAANNGGGAHSPEKIKPTQKKAVQEEEIF